MEAPNPATPLGIFAAQYKNSHNTRTFVTKAMDAADKMVDFMEHEPRIPVTGVPSIDEAADRFVRERRCMRNDAEKYYRVFIYQLLPYALKHAKSGDGDLEMARIIRKCVNDPTKNCTVCGRCAKTTSAFIFMKQNACDDCKRRDNERLRGEIKNAGIGEKELAQMDTFVKKLRGFIPNIELSLSYGVTGADWYSPNDKTETVNCVNVYIHANRNVLNLRLSKLNEKGKLMEWLGLFGINTIEYNDDEMIQIIYAPNRTRTYKQIKTLRTLRNMNGDMSVGDAAEKIIEAGIDAKMIRPCPIEAV